MRSPFPGMDPFIEASGLWEDFHGKLVPKLEETLSRLLPAKYLTSIGERFYIVANFGDEEDYRSGRQADVSVGTPRGQWKPGNAPEAGPALAELGSGPITMTAFVEEEFREHFIEIREANTEQRLVTVIELLSPSNKRFDTEGWHRYLRKRQACLDDPGINFVEVDLLRGGQRMPMRDPWPICPYYLLVNRRHEGLRCRVWPAASLQPLPQLLVPLIRPDEDVSLDLQGIVSDIYDRSHYEVRINYAKPKHPVHLSPEEPAWIAANVDVKPSP